MDLEFPDWTGMDDSSVRITPEAAFQLCELYPQLLAHSRRGKHEPIIRESIPEFVL
jgi:hypothetical protein